MGEQMYSRANCFSSDSWFYVLSVSTINPFSPPFSLTSFLPLYICFWLPCYFLLSVDSHLLLPISHFVFFLLSLFLFSTFLLTVWLAGASGEEGGCLGLRYCFACPRQSSSLPTHKLCALMHYSLSLVHSFTWSYSSCFQSYTYLCSIILQSW